MRVLWIVQDQEAWLVKPIGRFANRLFVERLLLLVIVSLVLIPPTWRVANRHLDYLYHGQIALSIAAEGLPADLPHFLYHLMVAFAQQLLPNQSVTVWLVLPAIVANTLLALLIHTLLRRELHETVWVWLALPLTITLLIVEPILIGGAPDYLGYFHPNVVHSPTYTLLRLFAIPVSLLAARSFRRTPVRSGRWGDVLLAGSLVILMTLTKPSYTIVLLPALLLMALIWIIRRKQINFPLLIGGLIIPSLVVLALQYFMAYLAGSDSGILFGPFQQVIFWGPPHSIAIRTALHIVASTLFPVATYMLFLRQASRDAYPNVAWLSFLVAVTMAYTLYEGGERFGDGNFFWSAYIALFVLMFASVRFILTHLKHMQLAGESVRLPLRLAILTVIYALHVASGVKYLVEVAGS
jgi:hypothetical protein